MTNGLTDVKTTLFVKYRNCQLALQKLLEEQSDIRQHLRSTNRFVQYICFFCILLQYLFLILTTVTFNVRISNVVRFQSSPFVDNSYCTCTLFVLCILNFANFFAVILRAALFWRLFGRTWKNEIKFHGTFCETVITGQQPVIYKDFSGPE